MSKLLVRIYQGNGEFIDREMTDEEIAQQQKDKADGIARRKALAEAALNKAALLDRLGITESEAKLLLS